MKKNKEETSLVVVDNSILGKMKNFFRGIISKFSSRYEESDEEFEAVENNKIEEKVEVKKPKLFNYDDPQNYFWNEENINREEGDDMQNNVNDDEEMVINNNNSSEGISKYFDDKTEQAKENKAIEDDDYVTKDELQEKLMNYYASIKKAID